MSKIDLKTEYRSLYNAPTKTFVPVEVPPLTYLVFDGGQIAETHKRVTQYRQALEALYSLAYTLKFMSHNSCGRDYVVGPLECLWMQDASWKMMILQPDWLGPEHLKAAMSEVLMKSGRVGLERVRLETLNEGLCAQTLHTGKRAGLLEIQGLNANDPFHVICLSDICKTEPDKRRMIIRQPVKQG